MKKKTIAWSINELTPQQHTRRLVETAVMLGLATVLSLIKLWEAPFGGTITFVSMLPVVIISYRYGVRWGTLSSITYGLLQLLTGLNALRGSSFYTVIGAIFLDYLIAFALCALGALFRNMPHQKIGLTLGVLLACIGRFLCHFVSGMLIWREYATPGMTVWYYSLTYNGGYMLPETIITMVAAFLLSLVLNFRNEDITTLSRPGRA